MTYPVLLTLHLFGALVFIGAVFFEVLILDGVRKLVRPGALLALKILLALSVLAHFIRAITWSASGRMTSRRFRFIHVSVFCHMVEGHVYVG